MIEEEDGEEEDDKTEEDCNLWEENAINERRNTGCPTHGLHKKENIVSNPIPKISILTPYCNSYIVTHNEEEG